uniref:Uncharacterized protein n=1 Tax=Panagrolaimus sp. JU765 TaxID=591449 RepID=A0AC34Q8Z4_9BILA
MTILINVFGISYIIRCPFKIIGAYKYHLLNIAICATIVDLHLSFYFVGYPLLPVFGFCAAGWTRNFDKFFAVDLPYAILIQLFGMYGLSLVNAILYHMTKILGNKTIFRSKKAVIISMTIQIVYPMPAWIFHLCLTSSKSDIITYAQIHMQQAAQYIESHACSFLILSSPVYVYFAISLFLVFLCSTTVFVCCVIAVLLLMRNKSAKLSKDYRLFKEMTIGLISQLVFPLLTALLPMIWMAYEILRTSGNPAETTPMAFQIFSSHSVINILAMAVFTKPLRRGLQTGPIPNIEINGSHELFERRHPVPSRPQTTSAVLTVRHHH